MADSDRSSSKAESGGGGGGGVGLKNYVYQPVKLQWGLIRREPDTTNPRKVGTQECLPFDGKSIMVKKS